MCSRASPNHRLISACTLRKAWCPPPRTPVGLQFPMSHSVGSLCRGPMPTMRHLVSIIVIVDNVVVVHSLVDNVADLRGAHVCDYSGGACAQEERGRERAGSKSAASSYVPAGIDKLGRGEGMQKASELTIFTGIKDDVDKLTCWYPGGDEVQQKVTSL